MAEPSSELVSVQWGVETTPGTPVAASKRFTSFGVTLSPDMSFDEFTAQGFADPTVISLDTELSQGDIDGRGSYNDIVYPASGIIDTATVSTPVGATNAKLWLFEPNPTGVNALKAFTVERSNGVVSERAAGCRVASLDFDFSGAGVQLGGTLMGGALETGITMTASPTSIAVVPIMRSQISVYLDQMDPADDDTAWDAAFGTTKLTRARVGTFSIGDKASPWFAHNAANGAGPATWIERRGTKEIDLTFIRDATAMALLANARAGDVFALRVEAVGAEIDSGIAASAYRLTLDLAVMAMDGFGADDDDGAEVTEVSFKPVYAAGWERAMRMEVVNTLATL